MKLMLAQTSMSLSRKTLRSLDLISCPRSPYTVSVSVSHRSSCRWPEVSSWGQGTEQSTSAWHTGCNTDVTTPKTQTPPAVHKGDHPLHPLVANGTGEEAGGPHAGFTLPSSQHLFAGKPATASPSGSPKRPSVPAIHPLGLQTCVPTLAPCSPATSPLAVHLTSPHLSFLSCQMEQKPPPLRSQGDTCPGVPL